MTIKKFAFEVQSSLNKAHGIDLKRSHVHEVLATLFGFASYTALSTQRVLAQHDGRAPAASLDIARAAARASDLGYAPPKPPIIATLVAGQLRRSGWLSSPSTKCWPRSVLKAAAKSRTSPLMRRLEMTTPR